MSAGHAHSPDYVGTAVDVLPSLALPAPPRTEAIVESRAASGGRGRPGWLRLRVDQRIGLFIGTLCVVAIALFFGVVVDLPRLYPAVQLPWLVWVAAFALGESLVVHVQVRRDSHTFSLTDLVLVAALCLTEPATVVTAHLVGTAVVLLLDRRQSVLKTAFNLAQFALVDCVTSTVFALVTRGAHWSSLWTWAGALLAVAVSTLSANVLVFGVIALSDGPPGLGELRRLIVMSMPFALEIGAVGLLVVRTAVLDPVALVLLVPPALLMLVGYQAYTHVRRQEDNLRLLYEVTSLLYDGSDARDGLGNFVAAVREAFRARVAELVLLGDDGVATMTRSREGQDIAALLPLEETDDIADLLSAVTSGGLGATRTGMSPRGPLEEYVARRGLKDAVMSVLRTEDQVHGLLVVAGRLGEVSRFTGSDLTLLATFGRHVATSLERGRLQSDLRHVTDMQEKLRHQAMHDAMTGLPNRTLFLDRTQNALRLAGRTELWPAVFYLDLDGFKPVNDTYGHEAGDVVLRAVAERLRGCLRSADTAARLGGDEFAVLVNGPIDEDGVERVVGRIRAAMAQSIDLGDGRQATVGASIGVAIADHHTADVESLVRHADASMYAAKRAHDGRHVIYQEGFGTTGS